MIQANELRIGNLIQFINKDGVNQIDEVLCVIKSDSVYTKKYDYRHDVEDINPIPLTEEWLLKFVFETDNICFYKENFTIGHFAGNMFIWLPSGSLSSSKYGVEIKTIHHLQNMYFSLFEQELVLSTVLEATKPAL